MTPKLLKSLSLYLIIILVSMTDSNVFAAAEQSLRSIDGSEHKLSEYIGKGKWVVLNIWGTRCPPCREEIPELVSFHDQHKDKDAIVVGVAIDFPSFVYAKKDEVIAFADDYLIDFPVLLSDGQITEKIGLGVLEALPTTYVYTPKGNLIGMRVGGITQQTLEEFINKNAAITPSN